MLHRGLIAGTFCQWLNNELLPNSVLEPGYPRRVSVETLMFYRCQRGCECPDVVETREKFLRKMTACGILRPDNAPT